MFYREKGVLFSFIEVGNDYLMIQSSWQLRWMLKGRHISCISQIGRTQQHPLKRGSCSPSNGQWMFPSQRLGKPRERTYGFSRSVRQITKRELATSLLDSRQVRAHRSYPHPESLGTMKPTVGKAQGEPAFMTLLIDHPTCS